MTAWHSYRAAIKAYKGNPSAFSGLPEIAGDKGTKENRSDGSYAVLYKNQAFSKRALKKRRVDPSRTHFYQRTEVSQRALIRIVTEVGFYVIEIAGVQPPEPRRPEGGNYAAADQGLNNLATSAHSKSERTAQESELRGDCLGVGRVGSLMRIEMPPII
ncbi:MAG: hypothetical protein KME26_25990 [Oscillatoria princeps RMCB-10]|nr:hypothetical protein [Oscillatoria princeps RMCB-10]